MHERGHASPHIVVVVDSHIKIPIDLLAVAISFFSSNQQLKSSMKEPNILIYFFFPPITQSCSVSDVLFIGGRGVSDFSVLKYY